MFCILYNLLPFDANLWNCNFNANSFIFWKSDSPAWIHHEFWKRLMLLVKMRSMRQIFFNFQTRWFFYEIFMLKDSQNIFNAGLSKVALKSLKIIIFSNLEEYKFKVGLSRFLPNYNFPQPCSQNFCQIKIFPSLVRKNTIVCLLGV